MTNYRVFLFFLLAFQLAAADKWIRLSTGNFELYTNNSEAVGRETIRTCEHLRQFYEQLPEYRQKQLAPVRIVEFSSKEQFLAYQSVGWEAGHYETNGSRDWIALGPDQNTTNRAAMLAHEYHHMAAERAGLRLPHWLSEGLAEVFSTVKPVGDKTMAGGPLARHLATLESGNWMSIESLTAVNDSGYSSLTGDEANVFYAVSWILTQYLFASPEYGPSFPKFMAAIGEGRPAGEAMERAFGRSAHTLAMDAHSYMGTIAKLVHEFPARMDSEKDPIIETADTGEFEIALVMADLLSVMRKDSQAQRAFEALNSRFVALDEIQRAPESRAAPLAGMYFHIASAGLNPKQPDQKLLDSLKTILDLPQVQRPAAGQTGTMAEVYYQFARVEREARAPLDTVATALRRVLQLQPEHDEAKIRLGELYLEANRLAEAAAAFMLIPVTSTSASYAVNGLDGVATEYLRAGNFVDARRTVEDGRKWVHTIEGSKSSDELLAYIAERSAEAYLESGHLDQARASLDAVRNLVNGEGDMRNVERLRGLIEARSKGRLRARPDEKLLHVEGVAVALDCPLAGPLLRVKLESAEMVFDLPDPSAVEVNSSGRSEVNLQCGVLKPFRIAVDYAPPGVTSPKSSGIVRKMAF